MSKGLLFYNCIFRKDRKNELQYEEANKNDHIKE